MADTEAVARFDHKNRGAYLKCFIDSFNYLDSELADPGRFPKGRNWILIKACFQPTIYQTGEMAMDSGSHLGPSLCTENSTVPKLTRAPGSLRNYKLMFW